MDFRQEIAAIFEEDIVAVNVCLLIVLRPSIDSWEFIPGEPLPPNLVSVLCLGGCHGW